MTGEDTLVFGGDSSLHAVIDPDDGTFAFTDANGDPDDDFSFVGQVETARMTTGVFHYARTLRDANGHVEDVITDTLFAQMFRSGTFDDAVVARFNANGSALEFATSLGGEAFDTAHAVVVTVGSRVAMDIAGYPPNRSKLLRRPNRRGMSRAMAISTREPTSINVPTALMEG